MSFAGFDLGGNCGYAILSDSGQRIASGTIKLGKRCPQSIHSFYDQLITLARKYDIAQVGYEKVAFFARKGGIQAAHAYGGYEAVLWLVSVQYGWSLDEIAVGTIKKLATGSGRAEKEDVEVASFTRWAYVPGDDNESDALWVAEYARRKFLGET